MQAGGVFALSCAQPLSSWADPLHTNQHALMEQRLSEEKHKAKQGTCCLELTRSKSCWRLVYLTELEPQA